MHGQRPRWTRKTWNVRATPTRDLKWSGCVCFGVNGHKTMPNAFDPLSIYVRFLSAFDPFPVKISAMLASKRTAHERAGHALLSSPGPPVGDTRVPLSLHFTKSLSRPSALPSLPPPWPATQPHAPRRRRVPRSCVQDGLN